MNTVTVRRHQLSSDILGAEITFAVAHIAAVEVVRDIVYSADGEPEAVDYFNVCTAGGHCYNVCEDPLAKARATRRANIDAERETLTLGIKVKPRLGATDSPAEETAP